MRLGGLLVPRRVADDFRRGERLGEFLIFVFDLIESFKHDGYRLLATGFRPQQDSDVAFWISRRAEEKKSARRGPLGNHEFAAVLLFEFEGGIEGADGADYLLVGWRLRCDPLQPESRLRQQREE